MSVSQVLSTNKNQAYLNAVKLLEGSGSKYIVNDPVRARKMGRLPMRLSDSSLISIIPLQNNQSDYVMNVTDNNPANVGNPNTLPMEYRLPMQDVFFTASFGYFICVLNDGVNAGTAIYPQMHFQFFTYPVPGIGGVAGVADLAALLGLWSTGNMEWKVGGDTQVPRWWLQRHALVPQTESIFAFTSPNPYWDQQNYADDGYLPVTPNWIINGSNLNQFTIKFGNDYSQIWQNNPLLNTAAGAQLGIACVWNGWQAQNASSIMNNQPES